MGYYTDYKIEIIDPETKKPTTSPDFTYTDIRGFLKERSGYTFYEYNYDNLKELGPSDAVKWYDYNVDMIELSIKYPQVVFVLKGLGEEYPDIWKAFYKNGQHYIEHVQIIINDFDQSLLK